jgi:peptidoglycan/xylan/chitin deacetylase (PgdA/CDA1 family)
MSILRELISALFRFSGLPHLIRAVLVRRKATIIFYHDPDPATLERHLRYLSGIYHFIPLDLLVDAIRAGDWSRIPRRSMVITIDDGHQANARLTEIFERYRVRPTLYLCSQIVGTRRSFWFKLPGVDAPSLKALPQAERLKRLKTMQGWEPSQENAADAGQALSIAEIRQMKTQFDFGSHTRFHPILTACSDEESRDEILRSKAEVEELTGGACRHFSFPNGDYSERELAYAEAAGYLSARTIDLGWNGPDTDPYLLKMTGVSDDASINVLASQVVGFPTYFSRLLKGSLRGKHRIKISRVTDRES